MALPDLKPFAGAFLLSPIPLELSFHWCSYACTYCFANLNTPHRRANLTQLLTLLAEYPQRETLEARLLQQGYPVCISNLTDMFAPSNYHAALPIIELLAARGIPMQFQTRGTDRQDWREALLARVERPSVWYISIATASEAIRRQIEPHAPTIAHRLALIERLRHAGHTVVVGLNPVVPEWCGDPAALLAACWTAGAQGVWIERLHLNATQIGNMPPRDQQMLGRDLLRRARARQPAAADRAVFDAARAAAQALGLPIFSYGQPTASTFFDPYHAVYDGRTFPTTQDFINHCHQTQAQHRLISFAEYAQVLLRRFPDGTHALDQYLGSTAHTLWRHTAVPSRMTYADVLRLGWQHHEPKFSPVALPCCAWAARWDASSGGWHRYCDADGLPLLVFRPDATLTGTCVAVEMMQ